METLGFDVYVVVSVTACASSFAFRFSRLHALFMNSNNFFIVAHVPSLTEQLEWLSKKLPESWCSRIICCRDKTLLTADYLIDVAPNPFESFDISKKRGSPHFAHAVVKRELPWKVILLDRPFNQHVQVSPETPWFHGRFPVWKQWSAAFENVLNVDLRNTIVSYAHGSPNSLDEDRMYVFPSEHINTVVGEQARAILDDGIIDVNLIDIDADGYVCDCYKGQNDEVHNALSTTFPLHKQRFQLPKNFGPKVQRIVALKYLTGMRRVFIRLTELELTRDFTKATLRNHDPLIGPAAFAQLDFVEISPEANVDLIKTFAFQMGQMLGLFVGLDLFAKNDIVAAYPELEPFVMRKREESLQKASILNEFRTRMLNSASSVKIIPGAHQVAILQLSPQFINSKDVDKVESWNAYMDQSNAMVVDFKDLSIVSYPPCHTNSSIALLKGKYNKDTKSSTSANVGEPALLELPTKIAWARDPPKSTAAAVLPPLTALAVGRESHGHLVISDMTSFDSSDCIAAKEWFQQKVGQERMDEWPWHSRYLFFDRDPKDNASFVLVALRSKFSHLFLPKDRLEELAKELGVGVLAHI